jgi:hypothetical protein
MASFSQSAFHVGLQEEFNGFRRPPGWARGIKSPRAVVILDPFGGSGTTLIAAQKSGRLARLIEYDPACQSASKNDPWSASNFDPVWRAGFSGDLY